MAVPERTYKSASAAIDGARLAAVMSQHGLGRPASIAELEGGGARSFRIDRVDDTPLVLKAFDDEHPYPTQRETFVAELLRGVDVPFPRFLAADESRKQLPFRFTIASYLLGERVALFRNEPGVADLYRRMGGMLRKLHTITLPAYGQFGEHGVVNGKASNAEYVGGIFAHGFERFRHFGAEESLARRLEAIVDANSATIAWSRGAVFAHDDFQPHNVLAARDEQGQLQLTGLVDFGNARAADPVCDLAKALFCCEHDAPGSGEAIRQGYGPIDHPDPDRAIWINLLLHRLVMWWWLRHVGVIAPGEHHDLMRDLERMADEGPSGG